jgi:arylsulfatase A-like enzyme
MSSPNILLILVDQHRYDCVGANAHPLVQTPNLDRLAHEGVNFSHAFTPIAVCCPARASLITGLWPVQHGVLFTEMAEAYRPMRPGLPAFPRVLAEKGYYIACAGKWHAGTEGGPLDYGFEDYIPESGYARWREAQGLPPPPRRNGFFGETDPAVTAGQSRLAWTAGRALTLLQKARDRGQPFFIMWSPSEPHLPNVVPEPYASLYPPAQVPPWPSFSDPLEGKPYIQRQQRVNWDVEGWTWAQWAPTVARYLGEITLLDAQVGRLLAELDALGLADDTVVIYTSDHGDLCGGHGMVDKHYVMYDDVMRVPFIVRWPRLSVEGAADAGRTCDAFVTTGHSTLALT